MGITKQRMVSEWRYTILVEGQMDLLMCHQSGLQIQLQHLEHHLLINIWRNYRNYRQSYASI